MSCRQRTARPGTLIRALAAAVVLTADALAAPQDTVISARCDLNGWLRSGAVDLALPSFDAGVPAALFDDDPLSVIHAPGVGPHTLVVSFRAPQDVERVDVVNGGSSACLVRLTVVDAAGDRFQAGEAGVSGGQLVPFHLMNVSTRSLSVEVEAEDPAAGATLAGLAVHGRIRLVDLVLEDVPESVPEGGAFAYRVTRRDSLGGRPDLTDRAQLVVQPARSLSFEPASRAVTRVRGPVTIEPRLGALAGAPRFLLVTAVEPPPPAPEALPGLQLVTLLLQGEPPFEVFRRHAGEKGEQSLGRTERAVFHDDSVLPGTAYSYSVRRIDRFDNPLTAASEVVRVRTWTRPPPGWIAPGRVPVLVALFVDSLEPDEESALLESLEAARRFVYRHSGGRIVLDTAVLRLPGPTPPTAGPSMAGIEARLRQQGVRDDAFGVVFAVADDIVGDFGGFSLLGQSVGAMGRGTGLSVPTLPGAMGPDPGFAFAFIHELRHALARVFQAAAHAPQPSGHFDEDFGPHGVLGVRRGRPFDAGEAWDAHARLLAEADGWDLIGAPWRRPFEVLDTDGDGLADDDGRLPVDEARLGTDPLAPDTDGDGLDDFAEFGAGLFRGSDPLAADTDGDGQPDALDPWPLHDFAGVIARGGSPRPLASLPSRAEPSAAPLALLAAWDEGALHFEILTDEPCDAFLELDGSGLLGRWETDVDTGSPGAPAADVYAGAARIALRAHTAPRGVFVGERLVPDARLSAERDADGRARLVVTLPAQLGPGARDAFVPPGAPREPGLRLRAGTVLGLALTVRPSREVESSPFEACAEGTAWRSLFEPTRLLDARLAD